jgi:hypothetical protein
MQNNFFTILAIVLILFGLALSLINPLAGLFMIGAVLIGGIVLLVYRLMKL